MRKLLVVLLVLALLGAGGVAFADARKGGPSYRTARASLGDVEQTLSLSGTISPAGLTELSFATSGKVARVAVRQGQRVRSGQVLARLDAVSLRRAVTDARATLAKARATLSSDEAAQAAAVKAAAKAKKAKRAAKRAARKAAKQAAHSGGGSGQNPILAQLAKQQQAVIADQSAANAAITTAKQDLEAADTACNPSSSPSASPSDSSSESPSAGSSDDCTDALAQVQTDQDAVSAAQDKLQQALTTLSNTLVQAIGSLSQTGGSGQGGGSSSHQSGNGTTSSSGSSFSGQTVTAAQLARDQSSIDAAKAALVAARQSRKQATLRAPYAGRTVSVDVARGDSVSTSTEAFVLVARGVTTVTTSVTTSQIDEIKVGQTARVTPSGASRPLSGRVSAIGLLPTSSSSSGSSLGSSSSTSYSVTITLDHAAPGIPAGATASVSVVIGTAHHVVTVPTSAVTPGARAVVEVVSDGGVTITPVTLGVVGLTRTQINSGLTAGQVVVLANLSAAVPSNTTGAGFSRFGGFGGGPRISVNVVRGGPSGAGGYRRHGSRAVA